MRVPTYFCRSSVDKSSSIRWSKCTALSSPSITGYPSTITDPSAEYIVGHAGPTSASGTILDACKPSGRRPAVADSWSIPRFLESVYADLTTPNGISQAVSHVVSQADLLAFPQAISFLTCSHASWLASTFGISLKTSPVVAVFPMPAVAANML
ncbi:Uncharacterised protein [Chlamydia trachomatis]|nr:Uncharacterised protein [Chlamydia trachomatis]